SIEDGGPPASKSARFPGSAYSSTHISAPSGGRARRAGSGPQSPPVGKSHVPHAATTRGSPPPGTGSVRSTHPFGTSTDTGATGAGLTAGLVHWGVGGWSIRSVASTSLTRASWSGDTLAVPNSTHRSNWRPEVANAR